MHMVAHGSRDTNTTRRTFGLESRHHIYRVPVQICAIGNRVSDVDPDAETDSAIGG